MTGVEIKLPEIHLPEKTLEFVQRILGPFAEAGDFLSDKVKFYRWKASLTTLKRAQEIAAEYGIDAQEIPLKTFVPLLEKASLEEEKSPLIERWATLLAQAAADPNLVHPLYADVLSRLSGEDVRALESIIPRDLVESFFEDINIENTVTRIAVNLLAIQDATYEAIRKEIKEACADKARAECHKLLTKYRMTVYQKNTSIPIESLTVSFYDFMSDDLVSFNENYLNFSALDVLASSGLIVRRLFRFDVGVAEIALTLMIPTVLGVQFVIACRGDRLAANRGGNR